MTNIQQQALIAGLGSSDGQHVLIDTNASPGTALHTALEGRHQWEVVTLEFANTSAAAVTLTVAWAWSGSAPTSPNDLVTRVLPANSGAVLVIDRRRLRNGRRVTAWASTANVVTCYMEVGAYES